MPIDTRVNYINLHINNYINIYPCNNININKTFDNRYIIHKYSQYK